MLNPFQRYVAVERPEERLGNTAIYQELEQALCCRANTCVLGVTGSGKSSLLKCFFNREFRMQKAKNERILIGETELSTHDDGDAVCARLLGAVNCCIEDYLYGTEDYVRIKERIARIETEVPLDRLTQIITVLHQSFGYFIVLVMDGFDRFTSSPDITMEHHEQLRSLIEADRLQCIVATDYDLTRDSLPLSVRGSYLLQKFTNTLLVPAFTAAEAIEYINRQQETCDLQLSASLVEEMWQVVGGNPWLLEAAASCAYTQLCEKGDIDTALLTAQLYERVKNTLSHWCKLLTPQQVTLLSRLAASNLPHYDFTAADDADRKAVEALLARGLLVSVGEKYCVGFCSPLFRLFCQNGDMERAAADNPLLMEQVALSAPQTVINNFYDGSTQYNDHSRHVTDQSQHMTVENLQVNQGLSIRQIVELLCLADSEAGEGDMRGLFAQRLADQLRRNLTSSEFVTPVRDAKMSDAAYADEYDEAFSQYSSGMIQEVETDENGELDGVTPAALQTLDERFNEARARVHAELTDTLVNRLSERCRFYLKLSVIVEDALNLLGLVFEDFSPHLVLYGKTLEQALRDNFYELFHRETTLSTYDTFNRVADSASRDAFCNKELAHSYIGNFAFLMGEQAVHLASLCVTNRLIWEGVTEEADWVSWWQQLCSDIHVAREIRNTADHADSVNSPQQSNLQEMCARLFGTPQTDGILSRALVGKRLCCKLFPRVATLAEQHRLCGTQCRVCCVREKSNGGIDCELVEEGFAVKVAKSRMQTFWETTTRVPLEGRVLTVQIDTFVSQNGDNYFTAAPLAVE